MLRKKKGGATALLERPLRAAARVAVAYPRENETVTPPGYTLQVRAEGAPVRVDISIDQEDWLGCRESLGLWWYDWTEFDAGEHEIVARAVYADGTTGTSEPRIFFAAAA